MVKEITTRNQETIQLLVEEHRRQLVAVVAIEQRFLNARDAAQELVRLNVNIGRCFTDAVIQIEQMAGSTDSLAEVLEVYGYGQQQLQQLEQELLALVQGTAGLIIDLAQ